MFFRYVIAMGIAVVAIVIGVILGDYGPWYFSWFLGTGFMVLVAAAAGVLFEAQEAADAGDAATADPTPILAASPILHDERPAEPMR